MTKIKKLSSISTVIGYCSLVIGFTSCSDEFLQEKKNYDNVNKDMYNFFEGSNARLNDIYAWCLPQTGDLTSGTNYLSVSMGAADIAAKSTEESIPRRSCHP